MRGPLKWALLAFVAICALAIVRDSRSGREAPPAASAPTPPPEAAPVRRKAKTGGEGVRKAAERVTIIAYYFHGYARCATCRKLEEYSRQAVTEGFPEELRKGAVVFSAVNVEEDANRHYIEDYRLPNKSLVLQVRRGAKSMEWRNLDRIWELVGDRDAFLAYVRGEMASLRGGGS